MGSHLFETVKGVTVEIPPGKFYRRARPPSLNGFEWTAGSDEEVWYRRFDECEHEDDPPTPPRWPRSWSGAADAAKDVVIPPSPPRSSYSPSSCVSVDDFTSSKLTVVEYCRHRIKIIPTLKKLPPTDVLSSSACSINEESRGEVNEDTCSVPDAGAFSGVTLFSHWPLHTASRQRCKNGCLDQFSSIKCSQCNVHLCLRKSKNCFEDFHKDDQLNQEDCHWPSCGSVRQKCYFCSSLSSVTCNKCGVHLCMRKSKNCFLQHHKSI